MKNIFLEAESAENRARVLKDPDRLSYHLMPPVGWLNDPNGLYEKDGVYHIFYQYSPMDASGEKLKGWGHYTTKDFVHFTEEEDALFPDSPIDKGGAYSGSAFEGPDGTIHFFYTGNDKKEGPYDYINEGRQHWTAHFTTKDGKHFTKKEVLMKNEDYPDNLSCHVRDPKVIEEDGKYYMVLGARTRDSKGQVNVFESTDLENWSPVSVIRSRKPFGYMWECPDLFDLDGGRVLITCPQGVDQEGFLYENIYQNGYFLADGPLDKDQTVNEFQELDNGFDFYAPQTFSDHKGRRILIGWMGLPDADYKNPTAEAGWQHALTLPRQLHLKDGRVFQYPIEETLNLREEEESFELKPDAPVTLKSRVCEIQLRPETDTFSLKLRKDVSLSYKEGLLTFSLGPSGYGRESRHIEIEEIREIAIFSDTSSLEIFINGGERVITTRLYDAPDDLTLESDAPMKAEVFTLRGYDVVYR